MSTSEPPSSQPSNLGKVLRAFLRTILTIVLVTFVLAALAAAGYYGMVYVNNQAIVPAQNVRAGLASLSTRQARSDQSISQLSDSLKLLQAAHLQDGAKFDGLNSAVGELQTDFQRQNRTLSRLDDLETSLNNLTQQMDAANSTDEALQSTLAANDLSFQDIKIQVRLLQAMELLNRSRLYLLQANYGLASTDVDNARQILAALQPDLPLYQQDTVTLLVQRLNLANSNLPTYPILAGDDLEVAWGMLASGLPSAPTGTPTPSLGTSPAATYTPYDTPTPVATYTPYDTLIPLATYTPYKTLTPPATYTPIVN